MIKTERETAAYVCFNDGIQSFLNIANCVKSLNDVDTMEIKNMLLKAGNLKMIADRASKVVSQFIPS